MYAVLKSWKIHWIWKWPSKVLENCGSLKNSCFVNSLAGDNKTLKRNNCLNYETISSVAPLSQSATPNWNINLFVQIYVFNFIFKFLKENQFYSNKSWHYFENPWIVYGIGKSVQTLSSDFIHIERGFFFKLIMVKQRSAGIAHRVMTDELKNLTSIGRSLKPVKFPDFWETTTILLVRF